MGIKSIASASLSVEDFVGKVKAAVEGREIGKIVSFRTTPSEITVVFSKLGTTEISYAVTPQGAGFTALLKNEKVAFAHRPFRADIEEKLAGVMRKMGATIG